MGWNQQLAYYDFLKSCICLYLCGFSSNMVALETQVRLVLEEILHQLDILWFTGVYTSQVVQDFFQQ